MTKITKEKFICVVFSIFTCGCQQLPNREGIGINVVPSLDTGTIISSANGLLSEGISKVPGSICRADPATGKCDLNGLAPSQCIMQDSKIEVKPIANPSPSYHSLIDSNYTSSINVPFISPTSSSQVIEEVKASISGTASIRSISTDSGYPGIDGIKACLLHMYGPGEYGTVYWISSANIISVTKTSFRKVNNAMDVVGTGFGAKGMTFNSNGTNEDSIWVGILPHRVNVGTVSAPIVSSSPARIVSANDTTTVIKSSAQPPSPPAPTITESVITEQVGTDTEPQKNESE